MRDVAGNIAQASIGVRDASERVAGTASASLSIARDLAKMNATVNELAASSQLLHGSATDLSGLAQILADHVGKFQT